MVVLVELLEVSNIDLLQVINELLAHLIDCKASLYTLDQAFNIFFLKGLNTLTNLRFFFLFIDCLASNWSGYTTIPTL